jgi:single-stranded DNA-binding protein
MNICCITGYLTENPRVSVVDDIVLAEFTLVTYSYRRSKNTGEKTRTPTFINCEAWHTGAETIEKFATKGTKLTINASVKNVSRDNRSIVFRVNEFDFCQQDNDM